MEVRDPELRKWGIKQVYPRFFWKSCESCRLEYRGTPMWSWKEEVLYHDSVGTERRYVCQQCVPSYDGVLKIVRAIAKARGERSNPDPPPSEGWTFG